MERITLFYLLCLIGAILLIAVMFMGSSLKHVLRSQDFTPTSGKTGIKESDVIKTLLILISFLPFSLSAQDQLDSAAPFYPNDTLLWSLAVLDTVLFLVVIYIKGVLNTVLMMNPIYAAYIEKKKAQRVTKKIDILKVLQDSVDIEDEETVMTDHEYDGIRELDNNLPPWWKWGFYMSIVFAVVYLTVYHVIEAAPLQMEEYTTSVEEGMEEVQAYLASQSMNVDESNVIQLLEQADLDDGKSIFNQYCVACHREDGGGSVGPNLTDEYWIHGGHVKNLFTTVKYGANNGMKSWKDELNPIQMQQVVSYILTMQGTSPENPKEAEGEKYVPEVESASSDSTATETVEEIAL